ncbi:MAG: FAD-binding oxidoreductase [Cytophagales bacterium]|nr:MAG: FAD-binding oxidoreductase [Cytophagales bacterium]
MARNHYSTATFRANKIQVLAEALQEKEAHHTISNDTIIGFAKTIQGRVVIPTNPEYNKDRQCFNPAFQAFPMLIVYCVCFEDVRLSLAFAQQYNLWTVSRSGGHSLAGYSICDGGMILDTSGLNNVYVNPIQKFAVVGAGVNFGKFNMILNDYKLHTPGGGCPTVCVAGYMQGGGYGFTSREFGINCDNVLAFTMMLAGGKIVVANEHQNKDLFWAVRGGTGNNFGVLLDITYQLYDLYEVSGYSIRWCIEEQTESAAQAAYLIQRHYTKNGVSKKLGQQTVLGTDTDGKKYLEMQVIWHGTNEEGKAILAPLLALPDAELSANMRGTYFEINEGLLENIPNVPMGVKALSESGYIARQLEVSDWKNIIDFYKTCPNTYTTVDMEGYGGAINEKIAGSNAFIHRDVYMDFFCDVFWTDDQDRETNEKWLDSFMDFMQPYFNSHSYQNYPNRRQINYRWAYWGDYFNTLLFVKQKYDPANFFHYQQSISPYPTEEGITVSEKPSLFADKEIIYQ